jgi:hypothetical protein
MQLSPANEAATAQIKTQHSQGLIPQDQFLANTELSGIYVSLEINKLAY